MKKFILAFAVAASTLSSTPVLAQSANDAMRYDEARDPAYQAAIHSGYGYGYGYGGFGGDLLTLGILSLFQHRPNPAKDNQTKLDGARYKYCPVNNDPDVPLNTPCAATPASAQTMVSCSGSCSYWDGDVFVTVVTNADGSQTITRRPRQR